MQALKHPFTSTYLTHTCDMRVSYFLIAIGDLRLQMSQLLDCRSLEKVFMHQDHYKPNYPSFK